MKNTRQESARLAKTAVDVLEQMIVDRNRVIAALLAPARETVAIHTEQKCGPDDECAGRMGRFLEAIHMAEQLES